MFFWVSDVWVLRTERLSIRNKQAQLKVSKGLLPRIHINYINHLKSLTLKKQQQRFIYLFIFTVYLVYICKFGILHNNFEWRHVFNN